MSYANFKPEIWSTNVLMGRDAATVAVQNSWRQFDGDIKKGGDRVHVAGLNGATIQDLPSNGLLADPEIISDSGLEIVVDQRKYINFAVDDIDQMQSTVDLMTPITQKTGKNYATMQDSFIYSLAVNAVPAGGAMEVNAYGSIATATTILGSISTAIAMLQSNNADSPILVELHPFVFQLINQAVLAQGNPNADTLKNGWKGPLLGADTYVSSLIKCTSDAAGQTPVAAGTAGAIYHCIVRTQEAIAFAEQKAIDFKPYSPEKRFGDAIKGYGVYGGKVTRPSELVALRVKVK